MTYDESVVVLHAHQLALTSLHAQHFGYGRGAFPYWTKAAQRGSGFRVEPLAFYTGMLAAPFRSRLHAAPVIALLILSAQVANAAGFFYEMGRSLLRRSRPLVDHSVLHDKRYPLRDVNVL
jgi:hypothetical protein